MELPRDINALTSSTTNTNNSPCPASAATSASHHFMKRINEPPSSKGQQPQHVAQNILQTHIEHHQHQHQRQQEQGQLNMDGLSSIPSPKPNQVGTVLLYGIPIVSLYIDSKERLCLAQISNTLLKQFSYNEIHNRRVALGITCVQCTPVQLEILRRAGAMPVSSRRCGMITRREAERLCKSFLGDNAPPRLPEDFAFSVHHKCAWGCRGSFLPSRYNSSRAKCIKCSFCGLFFSPNKFIFHSHRIGPGDKYVQPDAANFNSWRRHMKLSGSPPEEIVHAWEDVKAMFNGGTRKRLMTSANSPSSLTTSTVSASVTAGSSASSSSSSSSSSLAPQSPKRLKESSPVRSGAINTTVGQFPLRPLNVHHHHSNTCASSATANVIPAHPVSSASTDITLPFSRNFMMDYMWHTHAQNKSGNHFHVPNCTLPWIKAGTGSLIFANNNPGASVTTSTQHAHALSSETNSDTSNRTNLSPNASLDRFGSPPQSYPASVVSEVKALSGFYKNSAFRPVIQVNRSASSYSTATTNLALETVAAVAAAAAAAATSYDNDQIAALNRAARLTTPPTIKESFSSDDEMVDIETTEEEEKSLELSQQNQRMKLIKKDDLVTENRNNSDAPIDVDNSSDEFPWKGLLKKESVTHITETCRIQTPTSSLLSRSPASSINSEHHVSFQLANKSTSSTPEVILSTSPAPNSSCSTITGSVEQRHNCSPEQQRNVAVALASAFNHHRQHQLHHNQSQQPLSPQLAPQQAMLSASTSLVNGSTPLSSGASTVSLVHGRLTADINSNTSVFFGAISNSKNSSSLASHGTVGTPNTTVDSSNNNNSSSGNQIGNSANATISSCVNNEFWSVARLSLNRPPNEYNAHYRLPITAAFHRHHHDITKHFQAFRHYGHETPTQTNGVG